MSPWPSCRPASTPARSTCWTRRPAASIFRASRCWCARRAGNRGARHSLLAHKPVIAHAVFPELAQPRALQRFSESTRIVELGHSLLKELQNSFAALRIELAEFAVRGLGEFNAPSHDV